MDLRQAVAVDPEVRDFLQQRGSAVVARRGELVDALARPAVVATDAGVVAGVLTYDVVGDSCGRGFRLTAVRCGAVDAARRSLKPQIPVIGNYGIPIRDEIELAQDLPLSPTI